MDKLEQKGVYKLGPVKIISLIWVKKLVGWGYLAFLAYLQDVNTRALCIESAPIVL